MNTLIFALCVGVLLTGAICIVEAIVEAIDDFIDKTIDDKFKKNK